MIKNEEIFEPICDNDQEKYFKFSSFSNLANTIIPDGFPLSLVLNNKKITIYQKLSKNFIQNSIEQIYESKKMDRDIIKKILFLYKFNVHEIYDLVNEHNIEDLKDLTNNMSLYNYDYDLFLNTHEIELFPISQSTNFYLAFHELMNNKSISSNFRINIQYTTSIEKQVIIIDFTIYVLISYFNKIRLNNGTKLPLIMYKYLQLNNKKENNIPVVQLNKTKFTTHIELKSKLNRNPYEYQKYNIKWMLEHEDNIKNNLKINTYLSNSNYYSYQYNDKINNINNYLVCNSSNSIINPENLIEIELNIKGGILADEVGLGKTFSFIGLVAESLQSNKNKSEPTIVFCPIRLCKQWQEEINISSDLKSCIISTIIQYRKFVKDAIKNKKVDYDIVIVSYNFIFNENYKKHKELNTSEPNYFIENIKYKRVILDEGHEIFAMGTNNISKLVAEGIREYLSKNFKNCYKWICSATPCSTIQERNNVFEFLCDFNKSLFDTHCTHISDKYNSIEHVFQHFINSCSAKNTKKSVQCFVTIPEPNIVTKFIKQTDIEKTIYNSALGDMDKMIQLCSHIIVSDEYSTILGNKPVPLDEIQLKMVEYYKNAIIKVEKTIENCENESKKNSKKIKKKDNEIKKLEKQIEIMQNNSNNNTDSNNNTNNDSDSDSDSDSDDEETIEDKKNTLVTLKREIVEIKFANEEIEKNLVNHNNALNKYNSKHKIFNELGKRLKENNECIICFSDLKETTKAVLNCGHFFCTNCIKQVLKNTAHGNCPYCRTEFDKNNLKIITPDVEIDKKVNKWGSKMYYLIEYLNKTLEANKDNRIIVFSQWDSLLKLIGKALGEHDVEHIFLMGSIHVINSRISKFKNDPNIRIVLISSDREVSGLTLTEASHIVLLDTLNTDKQRSIAIETQAIGRSVRIGQTKQVQVKRLIMEDTIEHEFYKNNIEGQKINIAKYVHDNIQ